MFQGLTRIFEHLGAFQAFLWSFSCPLHCGPSVIPWLLCGLCIGFVFGVLCWFTTFLRSSPLGFPLHLLPVTWICAKGLLLFLPTGKCPVGCLPTWMSDLAVEVNELRNLVSRLTLNVDLLTLRLAELESQSQHPDTWELIEPEQFLSGGLQTSTFRAEEGPPPIPPGVLALTSVLSDIGGGREERARAAFNSGFWAQIALSTATDYQASDNPGLTFNHWIVLRGAGVSSSFRATRKSDLNRLVRRQPALGSAGDSSQPIVQGFASICELRVFCIGAGILVPPLLRWRSNWFVLQMMAKLPFWCWPLPKR